jgi:hypothetical protein
MVARKQKNMENREIKIKVCNPTSETLKNVSIFPWGENTASVVITSATESMTLDDIKKFFQENNFRYGIKVKLLKGIQSQLFVPYLMCNDTLDNEEEHKKTITITPYLNPHTTPEELENEGVGYSPLALHTTDSRTDIRFLLLHNDTEVVVSIYEITDIEYDSKPKKIRGKYFHFESLDAPYIIKVRNATKYPIQNLELFGAYKYLPSSLFDQSLDEVIINGAIVSLSGNKTYWHLLHDTMTDPFTMGYIHFSCHNPHQLCSKVKINTKDANGNELEHNLLNEKAINGKYYIGDYCKERIDCLTKIIIEQLFPETIVFIYVYPIKDSFSRRDLKGLNDKIDKLLKLNDNSKQEPEKEDWKQKAEREGRIVKDDMICPVTKEHCDDECCTVGSECNLSGGDGVPVSDVS